MNRPLFSCLVLAAGLALVACSEQAQDQGLQEPSSTATAEFVSENCNIATVNSGIEAYFSGNQRVTVRGYRNAMVAASTPELSRVQGFNILREIGIRSRSVPQLATTGSPLAVEVLNCIFPSLNDTDVIEQVPTPNFFEEELSNGGGFGVRGGSGDPTGPVQGVLDGIVIAGIAPPAPVNSTTWTASLDGQVLFYGEQGPTTGSYHWAVVPRAAIFDPELVVTTCVSDEATETDPADPNLMLEESNVGVLAFADATYIGCGFPPVAATTPAGGFNLLARLADLGRNLMLPEPVAATMLLPGTVGGRAGGVKSLFTPQSVAVAELSILQQPTPNPVKKNAFFTVKVQSKTPGGTPVNGVLVTVVATNNNGVPTALFLDPPGSAPEFKCGEPGLPACSLQTTSVGTIHGLADFVLRSTKSGAVVLVFSGEVAQRAGDVLGVSANKLNVKP